MSPHSFAHKTKQGTEQGNVLFMVLLAIVLIGALTAALQSSIRPEGSSIDKETLVIRASEVQRIVSEFERGVLFILQNGVSESDLRFAHPQAHSDYGDLSADSDPSDQLFHARGGGATYRAPPSDINDGSAWEFYGGTHLPGVGSAKPDLIAVLPNVTEQFCEKMNALNDQAGSPEDDGSSSASGTDAGDCLYMGATGRFGDTRQFYDSPSHTANTTDETSFSQDSITSSAKTALQACVLCEAGSNYHFYHVLSAR